MYHAAQGWFYCYSHLVGFWNDKKLCFVDRQLVGNVRGFVLSWMYVVLFSAEVPGCFIVVSLRKDWPVDVPMLNVPFDSESTCLPARQLYSIWNCQILISFPKTFTLARWSVFCWEKRLKNFSDSTCFPLQLATQSQSAPRIGLVRTKLLEQLCFMQSQQFMTNFLKPAFAKKETNWNCLGITLIYLFPVTVLYQCLLSAPSAQPIRSQDFRIKSAEKAQYFVFILWAVERPSSRVSIVVDTQDSTSHCTALGGGDRLPIQSDMSWSLAWHGPRGLYADLSHVCVLWFG